MNNNNDIENDVIDNNDEKLIWNSIQSEKNFVSIATFDEIDENINNAMKIKVRVERQIETKIQKLIARFEINDALLTKDVNENFINFHDLTQNSFSFFVVRTFVFKTTKFVKNVVISIVKVEFSKFFVFVKISVSISVVVFVFIKTFVKFFIQTKFFKKFKKRVKKTYDIESDNEKKRDKK